jgi:DNA gyrase/topoisomerase IV subunit B
LGIINKNKIKKKNLIVAVPSSGIHSNGYSLVRHIIKKKKINLKKNKFLKSKLIEPTKIYVQEILSLINNKLINGCANITGGGLEDNVKRIIPDGLGAKIDLNKIKTNSIFKWIKSQGVNDKEMIKTFNCGVGFCLIVNSKNLKKIKKGSKEFERMYEDEKSKLSIQRFKGLGEMNPEELWNTTLNPETRNLFQVQYSKNIKKDQDIIHTLMGNDVALRKEFIVSNAINVSNLDI